MVRLRRRDSIPRRVSTYAFPSQIESFNGTSMEHDYLYCWALAACLPKGSRVE